MSSIKRNIHNGEIITQDSKLLMKNRRQSQSTEVIGQNNNNKRFNLEIYTV